MHSSGFAGRFLQNFHFLPLAVAAFCSLDFKVSADAYVRFNQAGYITNENKTAILLASGTESGSFSLVSVATGSNVYTAAIPATSLGSWSATYPDTYALDFSSVTTPGKYLVQVAATINTTSLAVVIGSATAIYTPLLTNALYYYQSSRDGPNVITNVIKRKPSHLWDTNAITYLPPNYTTKDTFNGSLTNTGGPNIDASGGWLDAGDYIKLVETISYVEGMMLFALRDYPNRLATAGDFSGEAQYGLNFLLRMWDQTNKILYYQVSIGDGNTGKTISGDHDVWRLPEGDDLTNLAPSSKFYYAQYRRPVFRYGPANTLISPNLAGRLAADFALASQCFRATNVALANQCLVAAQTIFDLANTNIGSAQLFTCSPYDYYGESSWHDDIEWGAAELYLATVQTNLAGLAHTNAQFYLQWGAYWANQYNTSDSGSDSLNLYDTSAVGHYELYRSITQAGNPGGLAISQATLLAGIKSQLASGVTAAGKNPFSFAASYGGDPSPHELCYAITANLYKQLSGSNTYDSFGQAQRDWMLGRNSWGTTFIVGAGYAFPFCMQDQIANLAGSTNGAPPLRLGATVDGPYSSDQSSPLTDFFSNAVLCDNTPAYTPFNATKAIYNDEVDCWATSEPALDYTVPTIVLFAQIMGEISNTAATAAPVLSSAHFTNSAFMFNVTGSAGSNYIIQVSTNLAMSNWTAIFTNTAPLSFTDSVAGNFPLRFYRAVSKP